MTGAYGLWAAITVEINKEIAARTDDLASGSVPVERYREVVGHIRGLNQVKDIARRLTAGHDTTDDEGESDAGRQ